MPEGHFNSPVSQQIPLFGIIQINKDTVTHSVRRVGVLVHQMSRSEKQQQPVTDWMLQMDLVLMSDSMKPPVDAIRRYTMSKTTTVGFGVTRVAYQRRCTYTAVLLPPTLSNLPRLLRRGREPDTTMRWFTFCSSPLCTQLSPLAPRCLTVSRILVHGPANGLLAG